MIKTPKFLSSILSGSKSLMKKHTLEFMLIGGIFVIIIGAVVSALASSDIVRTIGEIIFKFGGAIIGAGVVVAILKSWQFTVLFQKSLSEVFYNPASLSDIIDVPKRWTILTESRLKGVLPEFYQDATRKIQEQFFDDELQYHFVDYEHKYDINVIENNTILKVQNIFKAKVIINPNCKAVEFKQSFEAKSHDKNVRLVSVLINERNYKVRENEYYEDENKKGLFWLKIDLMKINTCFNNDDSFIIERVVEYTQDLVTEPYIHGVISRYIKGGNVKARISEGYEVYFKQFGLDADNNGSTELYDGFKKWQLAERHNLLLPGQGYILIVTKEEVLNVAP